MVTAISTLRVIYDASVVAISARIGTDAATLVSRRRRRWRDVRSVRNCSVMARRSQFTVH